MIYVNQAFLFRVIRTKKGLIFLPQDTFLDSGGEFYYSVYYSDMPLILPKRLIRYRPHSPTTV